MSIPSCDKGHGQKMWHECYNCDDGGMSDHDCGEDVCCCLNPFDNVRCDICNGKGGWYQCLTCAPWEDE